MTDHDQAARLWLASQAQVGDYYLTHERPDWDENQNGIRGERSPDNPDSQ